MVAKPLVRHVLDDDALTRGLGDLEAWTLVEWLVTRIERFAQILPETEMSGIVGKLRLKARAISRFVRLWCHDGDWRAACQLAATQQFVWPLPSRAVDARDLMEDILYWESTILDEELAPSHLA